MNILTLNYEYAPIGGGGSLASRASSEALVAAGHKETVVTMGFRGLPDFETVNGVRVYRVPCWRAKAEICYPWEQLTYIFAAKRFLRKLLKKESFDVCHAHFIIPTGIIALWALKKYNIPYMITAHGSDVPGYNKKRFKVLHLLLQKPWRKICAGASEVRAVSDYLRGLILQGDSSIDCTVIHNGIDICSFRNGPKENSILAMTRLHKYKGVQQIIQAFAAIDHAGWRLDIAGDGPYRSELEALANKLGVADSTVFHGWVENKSEKHVELLARAKIFFLGSEFEGMPTSVLEGIAADCHVVLSDIPAHRYFKNFGAAFFPLGDADTLVNVLQETMKLPNRSVPNKSELSTDYMISRLEQSLRRAAAGD